MGSPIDIRLREAIVRAWHEERLTYAGVASLLNVGEATVSRVLRLHRETASVAPRARGGGNRSPIRDDVAKILQKIVDELPDATLDELTEALMTAVDIDTSRASVMRALHRMGFSRKKRLSPPSSEIPPSVGHTDARSVRG
jgi:transposase